MKCFYFHFCSSFNDDPEDLPVSIADTNYVPGIGDLELSTKKADLPISLWTSEYMYDSLTFTMHISTVHLCACNSCTLYYNVHYACNLMYPLFFACTTIQPFNFLLCLHISRA